jgi:hypothetical protein
MYKKLAVPFETRIELNRGHKFEHRLQLLLLLMFHADCIQIHVDLNIAGPLPHHFTTSFLTLMDAKTDRA